MLRKPLHFGTAVSGALFIDAEVLPGGKIEVAHDCLPVGETVQVSLYYEVEVSDDGGAAAAEATDGCLNEGRGTCSR